MILYSFLFFFSSLTYAQPTLVLFGPSQAGKSSFINTLAGKSIAQSGIGNGISTTSACNAYEVEIKGYGKVNIIDVPGLKDNRGSSDELIQLQIYKHIISSGSEYIAAIIFFEPLDRDTSSVKQTILAGKNLFGSDLNGTNAFFIFTMQDKLYNDNDLELGDFVSNPEEIIEKTKQECQSQKFSTLLWQNNLGSFDSSLQIEQEQNLIEKLKEIRIYKTQRLHEINETIKARATQLYNEQNPKFETKTEWVEMTEQKGPYTASASWRRESTPLSPQPDFYYRYIVNPNNWAGTRFDCKDIQAMRDEVNEYNMVMKARYNDAPIQLDESRIHRVAVNANAPLEGKVCDHKWVYVPSYTYYEPVKKSVPKTVEYKIERPLDFDYFYKQAKSEQLQQIAEQIKAAEN